MAGVRLGDLLPPPGPELCVHAGGLDHSRDAVRERARSVAAALGPLDGGPVGVLLPNGADAVAALFAVWLAGGVVVPLNPRLTDRELRRIATRIDLAAIVTESGHATRIPGPPAVVVGPGDISLRPGRPGAERYDESVAIVSFTSGTTGPPKPVPLLHDRIIEGADIATPLKNSGVFPPVVGYMISIGEQSGQLEDILDKVAEAYDEEIDVTTTSMTAVSVSMRSAQSNLRSPDCTKVRIATRASVWPKPTLKKAIHDSAIDANRKPVVTSSDGRSPIRRPNRPAMIAPSSGRKTIASYMSALSPS